MEFETRFVAQAQILNLNLPELKQKILSQAPLGNRGQVALSYGR